MLRQRKQELVSALQARADTPEVSNIHELLGLLLEESKRNLVKCDANDFRHIQGEAYSYDYVLRMLKRAPIPVGAKEE